MVQKRAILILAVLAGCALPLLGQTTKPAKDPGWAMSDEEIQRRLNDMNRKAATQPAGAGGLSREARRDLAQQNADLKRDMELQRFAELQAATRQAEERITEVDARFLEVRTNGRAAEQRLHETLKAYEIDSGMAYSSGRSWFFGSATNQWTGERYEIKGEITDPGAQLAAIQAVESRYGPELREAREQVSGLFYEQQALLTERQSLSAQPERMRRMRTTLMKRASDAVGLASHLDQLAWQEIQSHYPGVDVRALWDGVVRELAATMPVNNPQFRATASKIFNERAAAELARVTPATQPSR
jgi:outer membrane lipopolysaccharide assembly protein LptE/RlpB